MLTLKHKYVAVDQYGDTTFIEKHPRKELCEKYDSQHVSKMYIDTKGGVTHQTGYVIGDHWCDVFSIAPAFSK